MTRVSKMTSLLAFGAAGLFTAGAAQAVVVDFQESATGTQGNEPGALVFDQTLSNDTANSQTFTDGLGVGNDLTVSVTPDNHRVANNARQRPFRRKRVARRRHR